jgi:hypothetical protein
VYLIYICKLYIIKSNKMENYLSIRLIRNYKPNQQFNDNAYDFHLARRKHNIEHLLRNKREYNSSVNIYKNNTTNNNNNNNYNNNSNINNNMNNSNQINIPKLNINELKLPSQFEIDVYNYYSSVNFL